MEHIEFTLEDVRRYAKLRKSEPVHYHPYSAHCTITNYLKERLGKDNIVTAEGVVASIPDYDDMYTIPQWTSRVAEILDTVCAMNGNELTGKQVLQVLNNLDEEKIFSD